VVALSWVKLWLCEISLAVAPVERIFSFSLPCPKLKTGGKQVSAHDARDGAAFHQHLPPRCGQTGDATKQRYPVAMAVVTQSRVKCGVPRLHLRSNKEARVTMKRIKICFVALSIFALALVPMSTIGQSTRR